MAISTGTALALGGAGVLSSLLGGIFGSSSQASANRMNLQMARETNQMNYDMFVRQMAFEKEMWNKTNQWNSPQHQVQMLQQAGINPAAVYGAGSTADATPMSPPSTPSMQTAQVQPIDYSWIPNSLDMGVNAYFNNQILGNQVTKGKADSQIAKVNAEFELRTLEANCMKVLNDSKASEYAKDSAKVTLSILQRTENDSVKQAAWQTQIMQKNYEEAIERISLNKLQQQAQQIVNEYAPRMNDQQLQQYKAAVANLYSSARANDASASASHAQAALTAVQASGQKISNETASRMQNALVDKAFAEADNAYKAGQKVAAETSKTRAEERKLNAQDRYGEVGYRVLGSALPGTENRVKQAVKSAVRGKNFYGSLVDRSKRDVDRSKRDQRHQSW